MRVASFAFMELALIAMFLAGPGLMLVALVDLLRRPLTAWTDAGQDRLLWALIVVFVGFVGPVLYFVIAAPKLAEAMRRSHHPTGGGPGALAGAFPDPGR